MTANMVSEFCGLDQESRKLLRMSFDRFGFSARTYHKFLKVARTFADMDESDKIRKRDIAKALILDMLKFI